jgi:hypothetical protein
MILKVHLPPISPSIIFKNINIYKHRNSPTPYTSTMKIKAACTFETLATLPTSTWCKYPRAEFTSKVSHQ